MHICSVTQANRPASAATGQVIYNLTTSQLEVYDGGAWVPVGGVGAACLDAALFYDNTGMMPLPGVVPLDTVMQNNAPSNITLDPAGWVNLADDGDYMLRYAVAAMENMGGAGLPFNLQGIIQTSPTGLDMWTNVIGGDSYAELSSTAGGGVSVVGEVMVLVSGGGGLDVQIGANVLAGPPPVTFPQGSRLVVERVC